jgi:hypothetical protein
LLPVTTLAAFLLWLNSLHVVSIRFRKQLIKSCWIASLLPCTLMAQTDPIYTSLRISDGLPSNEIYKMVQDHNGFLWLGTDQGLVRYDGFTFNTFTRSQGLPGNSILNMYIDYQHRLWCSSYRGGICYLENEKVVVPPFNQTIKEQGLDKMRRYIHAFYVDSSDQVFMSFNKAATGYLRATIRDSVPTFVPLEKEGGNAMDLFQFRYEKKMVFSMAYRSSKSVPPWIERSPQQKNELDYTTIPVGDDQLSRFHFLTDADGKTLLYSINNKVYNAADQRLLSEHAGPVIQLLKDGGDTYVVTEQGIYHYHGSPAKKNFYGLYFKDQRPTYLLKDREGMFWVATSGYGLLNVPSFSTRVYSLNADINWSKYRGLYTLNNDSLGVIYQDRLLLFDLKSSSTPYYTQLIPALSNRRVRGEWLPNGHARLIAIDRSDNKRLVFRIARKNDAQPPAIHETADELGELQFAYLNDIHCSENGDTIYLLKYNGFKMLVHNTEVYNSTGSFDEDVHCAVTDHRGMLWLGTSNGLYRFDGSRYTNWGAKYAQFSAPISQLQRNEFGHIIVGTKGEGLGVIQADTVYFFDHFSDPRNHFVYQVKVRGAEIWASTNHSVILLTKQNEEYVVKRIFSTALMGYYSIDKLLMNNHQPVVIHQDKVIYLDPAVLNCAFGQEVYLLAASANKKPLDFTARKQVQLGYDEHHLQFQFGLRSLHQENAAFQYRLVGLFDNWVTTKERTVQFSKLPPGTYTLELKALDALGNWSSVQQLGCFVIQPHFSSSWWFIVLCLGCLFCLLLVVVVHQRKRSARETAFILSNINSLKRQINPHFIFNAINSVQSYIMANQKEQAHHFLLRFSDLIRNVVYSTDRKRVVLEEELKRIEHYVELERMRYENSFDWKVMLEAEVLPSQLFLPPMLLQPLIENAIHHGLSGQDNGQLTLRIFFRSPLLVIEVEDNGKGIDVTALKAINNEQSVGLNNVMERIQLISQLEKKQLTLTFGNMDHEAVGHSKGSKFTLTVQQ